MPAKPRDCAWRAVPARSTAAAGAQPLPALAADRPCPTRPYRGGLPGRSTRAAVRRLGTSAIGVGAANRSARADRLVSDPRRAGFVFGPLMLRGVVDLVLASFRSLPVALGALGFYGVGSSTGMVTFNSLPRAPPHGITSGAS